jgi:signal transduction histidine kinase
MSQAPENALANSAIAKTLQGLIAAAIIFLLNLGALAILSYRLADLNHWTLHTHSVIEELKDSLSALQDIETGDRGYIISGDPKFLEPFNWGLKSYAAHIKNLQTLTADSAVQQSNLMELKRLAQEKINFANSSVAMRKNDARGGEVLIAEGAGKQSMDAYRRQIASMIDVENHYLAERVSQLQNAGLLTGLSLLLLYRIFLLVKKSIADEQARVAALNAEIEQRKRTEKALKEATIRLTSSNTDLQQFAYVASHDLQEPLRAVIGFLTLLVGKIDDKLDPESKTWVNFAVDGAQRMRSLINDLLAYARVESRGKSLEQVDLQTVLNRVAHDLEIPLKETQATLTFDTLPVIMCDGAQLGQLFQNLTSNAIKFRSDKPPAIKITAEDRKVDWLFCVSDNGRGFDMEHAKRIFVIFQRLQGREEAPGTGIGLAVCKKIIERHNGQIWAESKPGEGASFFFTIPQTEGD